MQDILQYLLKWSVALAAVYIFYRLVLRPLTFYQWNRRYLVLYSALAFFIPFVDINTYVPPARLQDIKLVKYIPVINISPGTGAATAAPASSSIDFWLVAALLIATGSILLLTRLLLQWYSLRRIRRKAVPLYHPEANVYHVDEHVIPFSFGNSIYVNTSLHSEQELQDIILHEFVHVRQKHSFDIMWSEVLCILNWYNPFAWLIRHAIRQNLEFIADQAVLNNGLDKKTYQYHLLKVIGSSQYSIANKFNFSSLKKRIAMMNRLKSAKVHLVKFVFALPLLAVMLVAFRNKEGWNKQATTDTIPRHRITLPDEMEFHGVTIDHLRMVTLKGFYKRNPSVKEVAWSDEDELIVYLRNGKREVYDLENEEDMERFEDKYGDVPTIFPPPPPADPFAPFPPGIPGEPFVDIAEVEVPDFDFDIEVPDMDIEVPDFDFEVEVPDIDIDMDVDFDGAEVIVDMDAHHGEAVHLYHDKELRKFYKRNPQVQAIMWRKDQVIIKKKNGTVENYRLSDEEDMERFEDKYGDMPEPPPPPPAAPGHPEHPGKAVEPNRHVEVKSADLSHEVLTLKLRDGSVETYDLKKPAHKAVVEKKYGGIIRMKDTPKKAHRVVPVSI